MTAVRTEQVRSALEELADETYQRRVWTGGSAGREMSSLVECVERLYDDSGLDDAFERGEDVYGPAVDKELRDLGALVTRLDVDKAPAELVEDPLMDHVRDRAAALLRTLPADS